MNVAVKPEKVHIDAPLAGKLSLVSGSTSSIGLGIARALPAAGSGIVLDGFGKPDEVAALVHFLSSADCSFTTGFCFDISGGRATY